MQFFACCVLLVSSSFNLSSTITLNLYKQIDPELFKWHWFNSQVFKYFNDVQIQLVHVSNFEPFVLQCKHFNLSDRCSVLQQTWLKWSAPHRAGQWSIIQFRCVGAEEPKHASESRSLFQKVGSTNSEPNSELWLDFEMETLWVSASNTADLS